MPTLCMTRGTPTGDPRDWETPVFPEVPKPTGWVCPKCGASNSPFVTQCPSCSVKSQAPFNKPWPNWPYPYIGDPLSGHEPTVIC